MENNIEVSEINGYVHIVDNIDKYDIHMSFPAARKVAEFLKRSEATDDVVYYLKHRFESDIITADEILNKPDVMEDILWKMTQQMEWSEENIKMFIWDTLDDFGLEMGK